jgi:5'(3')-deoxyribonucleotidase
MENKEIGLRFNSGKIRYDLLEPFAIEKLAEVFTKGAKKYAPNNWLLGLPWMSTVASLERHLAKFKQGVDFDEETNLLHIAHVAWNAMALISYYKYRPEFDNRLHTYLSRPKIGLDIDEVLADFISHWTKRYGQEVPEVWNFDRHIKDKFDLVKDDKEFWMSIPVKTKPSDIHFEPHCYITSRSIPKEWTEEWLDKNGFPCMPVYSIGHNESKVEMAKKSGIELFVDDRFENFIDLNKAGICCFLFDAPHNQRYEVGYKRIFNLKDLE